MRPDLVLLSDIDQALAEAVTFAAGLSRSGFVDDHRSRGAVMYELIVVGEAAARVSAEVRGAHPEIEWPQIISFRNRATHAYFAVDWDIVYDILSGDVPRLRAALVPILAEMGD